MPYLPIFTALISGLAFWSANRLAALCAGDWLALPAAAAAFWPAIQDAPWRLDLGPVALVAGLIAAALCWGVFLYAQAGAGNFRSGQEHGSAAWGRKRDIAPLIDRDPDWNIILSATESVTLRQPASFSADRNKNVLVVGGSGSGKTFSIIKPNLMQLHSSYVVTDPKGTLLPDTGYLFVENGYELRCFNTVNFGKSLRYNPLAYIRREKDILKVVNVLIENTSGDKQGGDKFWLDCERLLYTALIAYLCQECPPEQRTIPGMIDLLELCQVREDDEQFQSPADILFAELEKTNPTCLAVKQYKKFRLAAGKTMKSVLISCAARLAPFDIAELRAIMSCDELKLDELGDRKTAFFLVMSDTDSTYSFLPAMIFYQMFNLLCDKADDHYGGKLPVHVRCLFDEFANCGKIPDFHHLISTIRSREISATIILQSFAQLDSVYKDDAETITDCCDTIVFLGGKSVKTTENIAKMIGKTTIDHRSTGETRGENGSFSLNNQIIGRDLIDAAEVGRLERQQCLVLIQGLPPFKSRKFNPAGHRRYGFLADSGRKPRFDPVPAFSAREA
ncbi:MAG: type IV secretory system conjugative DNA transfer family protein [Gracilibacteraceae bacterium]|jgi:type IV secretion system protein VirD4|nr:type IV secretory system conjugative DNA transfer family protein [Gracilibacteraceae bacterium]